MSITTSPVSVNDAFVLPPAVRITLPRSPALNVKALMYWFSTEVSVLDSVVNPVPVVTTGPTVTPALSVAIVTSELSTITVDVVKPGMMTLSRFCRFAAMSVSADAPVFVIVIVPAVFWVTVIAIEFSVPLPPEPMKPTPFSVSVGVKEFSVLDVPGHTAGHIAYFAAEAGREGPLLFCGDTLFSAGCGRLFEGTAAQMHASLRSLAALPAEQVGWLDAYTAGVNAGLADLRVR